MKKTIVLLMGLLIILSACAGKEDERFFACYHAFRDEYIAATDFLDDTYAISVSIIAQMDGEALRFHLDKLKELLEEMEDLQKVYSDEMTVFLYDRNVRFYNNLESIYDAIINVDRLADSKIRSEKISAFNLTGGHRIILVGERNEEKPRHADNISENDRASFYNNTTMFEMTFLDATLFLKDGYMDATYLIESIDRTSLRQNLDVMKEYVANMQAINSKYNDSQLAEDYEQAAYYYDSLEIIYEFTDNISAIEEDENQHGKCYMHLSRLELYRDQITNFQ